MEFLVYVGLSTFSLLLAILGISREDYFFNVVAGTVFIIIGVALINEGLILTQYGAYGFETEIAENKVNVTGIASAEQTLLPDYSVFLGMINILIAAYLFILPVYDNFIHWIKNFG